MLDIGAQAGRIAYITRNETVSCCTEEVVRLFESLGCSARLLQPTGAVAGGGVELLEASGPAGALHMGWKAGLNILEAACGIATRTRGLVLDARSVAPDIEVVATRKIFPGTKGIATKAVYAGGGLPHRLGLSESVLVFAQHTTFMGGKERLWERLPEIKVRAKEKKIGVEVTDEAGALRAARAGADIIQVDKLGPDEVASLVKAVRAVAPHAAVAAAGGINQENVTAYAATGVRSAGDLRHVLGQAGGYRRADGSYRLSEAAPTWPAARPRPAAQPNFRDISAAALRSTAAWLCIASSEARSIGTTMLSAPSRCPRRSKSGTATAGASAFHSSQSNATPSRLMALHFSRSAGGSVTVLTVRGSMGLARMRSQFSSGPKAMSAMASALATPSSSMPLNVSDLNVAGGRHRVEDEGALVGPHREDGGLGGLLHEADQVRDG